MTKEIVFKIIFAIVLAVIAYFIMKSVDSTARIIIGIIIAVPSLVLLLISRRNLGKSFAILPKAKSLVSTGVYSKLRHPMYYFLDMSFLGIFIMIGEPLLLILWVLFIAFQSTRAKMEEDVLANAFGEEYKSYKAQTWF